jgi:OmpA-OmpF porin, OOP family
MKKKTLLLLAGAAMACSHGAFAQATGGYVSVSGGASHVSADCSGTTACDDNSAAGRVLLGYRFLPNLALEASYAALGKITATVPLAGGPVDASIKGQSIGFGIAALAPFGATQAWTGIARVGVASVRASVEVSGSGISGSDSSTSTQAYAGLGLNYAVAANLDVGIAWDATRLKYAGSTGSVNIFSAVLGARF